MHLSRMVLDLKITLAPLMKTGGARLTSTLMYITTPVLLWFFSQTEAKTKRQAGHPLWAALPIFPLVYLQPAIIFCLSFQR